MNLDKYDYFLPKKNLVLEPAIPRDSSKLFIYHTAVDKIIFDRFYNLDRYLPKDSFTVLNNTKVLPPCHTMFQFNVLGDRLNLQLYQRSADIFLGVPFNIASYSLLLLMVSQIVDIPPGDFIHTFGDVHTYSNHQNQIKEQLKRKPRPFPKVKLNQQVKNIDDFKFEDITIENYNPHPSIKGEVTVVGGF